GRRGGPILVQATPDRARIPGDAEPESDRAHLVVPAALRGPLGDGERDASAPPRPAPRPLVAGVVSAAARRRGRVAGGPAAPVGDRRDVPAAAVLAHRPGPARADAAAVRRAGRVRAAVAAVAGPGPRPAAAHAGRGAA